MEDSSRSRRLPRETRGHRSLFQVGTFTNAMTAPTVPEERSFTRTRYTVSHTDWMKVRVLVKKPRSGLSVKSAIFI